MGSPHLPPPPPRIRRRRRHTHVRGHDNTLADALSRRGYAIDSQFYIDDVVHNLYPLPSPVERNGRRREDHRRPRVYDEARPVERVD